MLVSFNFSAWFTYIYTTHTQRNICSALSCLLKPSSPIANPPQSENDPHQSQRKANVSPNPLAGMGIGSSSRWRFDQLPCPCCGTQKKEKVLISFCLFGFCKIKISSVHCCSIGVKDKKVTRKRAPYNYREKEAKTSPCHRCQALECWVSRVKWRRAEGLCK